MAEWLFDRNGRPQIIEDSDCFRSADGRVIGWIIGNGAHALSGRHVAWYENGVLYDGSNLPIGFRSGATGYLPWRPGLSETPGIPGFAARPGRPGVAGVPGRPGFGGWSHIRLDRFFR
jgi:hypothetical protein